jgi:hypothetical protein
MAAGRPPSWRHAFPLPPALVEIGAAIVGPGTAGIIGVRLGFIGARGSDSLRPDLQAGSQADRLT